MGKRSFNGMICGIEVDAFAKAPTPEELGAIVAHWDSEDQAAFLISFGEKLRFCCPNGYIGLQVSYIRQALAAMEERLHTGYGSDLIRELVPNSALDDESNPAELRA